MAVQIIELLQLLKGIHKGPKSVMRVGKKLPFENRPSKWLFYQFLVLLRVLEYLTPKYKVTTFDSSSRLGDMLNAFDNAFRVGRNYGNACSGLHTCETDQSLPFQTRIASHQYRWSTISTFLPPPQ